MGIKLLRRENHGKIIAVAVVLYVAILSTLSIIQHAGLRTQMNDLGNMDQALWSFRRGDWGMRVTNDVDGVAKSRLAVHANFIFWVIGWLYHLWPRPEVLLVLTSLACGMAGLGIYLIARRHLGESSWALAPPIAFWLSPMVHDANLYDFHVVTLGACFLVWMIWAYEGKRNILGTVFLVLALMCKELMPPVMLMYGIYLLLTREWKKGVFVIMVTVVYSVVVFQFLIPYFANGKSLTASPGSNFRWLGSSLGQIGQNVFRLHERVIHLAGRPDRLRVPLYLLLSGGVVALRAWSMLLLVIPSLVECMLAQLGWKTRLTGTYYWVVAEAVIVIACILAAEKEMKKSPGKKFNWSLFYLTWMTIVFSFLFSPLPHGMGFSLDQYSLNPDIKTFRAVKSLIPPDAALSVQNNLGPHFSQRSEIGRYPRGLKQAEYVLFYARYVGGRDYGFFVRTFPPDLKKIDLEELLQSGEWGVVYCRDGFYVFKRGARSSFSDGYLQAAMDRDFEIMSKSYNEASIYRLDLSYWLNGPISWTSLFSRLKQNAE